MNQFNKITGKFKYINNGFLSQDDFVSWIWIEDSQNVKRIIYQLIGLIYAEII